VIKTAHNKNLVNVMRSLDELGVKYEELDLDGIKKKMPLLDTRSYFPVKLPDDPGFGRPTGAAVTGAIFVPESGYMSDPQLSTHNVQRAVEARGGEFMFNTKVVEIRKRQGRVAGITLEDGRQIDAPVVVNVAGPHSYIINRMAGVEEGMRIKTRALRQEVAHVPAPEGFDYQKDGMIISDGDVGTYSRPEVGNNVLVGSEDPSAMCVNGLIRTIITRISPSKPRLRPCVRPSASRGCPFPIPCRECRSLRCFGRLDSIYDKSDLPGFYMAWGPPETSTKMRPSSRSDGELIEKVQAGKITTSIRSGSP